MRVRSFIAGLGIAAVMLFGAGVGSAAAQVPIGPNQHFLGLVNGSNNDPAVYVVCPGPVYAGRTGPVAGGQTMSVAQVASGGGYTGVFSNVNSWFVPASPVAPFPGPTELKFTEYGVPQSIPTSIQVPCGGTGQVEFSSCPYLAPCAYGWVPDYVNVRFIDIAA
jgi:hypothetical protein